MEIKKDKDVFPSGKTKGYTMSIFKDAYAEWLNDLEEVEKNGLVPTLKNIFGDENVFVIDEDTNWNELPKLNGETK